MSDPHYRSGRHFARPNCGLGICHRRSAAHIEANARRPHRGLLPDVDFDRAVPDPGHRSLLARSAISVGRSRRSMQPDAEAELRAAPRPSSANGLPRPILRRRGRRSDSRLDRGFAKAGRCFDTNRLRARRLEVARASHQSSATTMFRWFEKRLDPFPPEEPIEPPKTLVAFCVHYTRGAWPYIIVDAVLVAAIAIAEVWMFGFLGRIVDWLSVQNRATFLATESWKLAAGSR